MMPIYAATAAVLLSTTAMAQTAAPTSTMGATTSATAATGMAPTFVTRQMADQHMASNLIGSAVRRPADEDLGDINDLLIDHSGNVAAVVIDVSSFGIGEKDVAVSVPVGQVTRVDGLKDRLVLRKTKDEAKRADLHRGGQSPRQHRQREHQPSGHPAGHP